MPLPRLADLLADNPIHRAINDATGAIRTLKSDLASVADSLRTNPVCPSGLKPSGVTKSSPVAVLPGPIDSTIEVPTEEDTVIELKNRLLDQLADAEDDLEHELKIKAGDGHMICCTCMNGKHDVKIKSKCRELMPKESSNPLYGQIINWFDTNKDKLTASACKTGQYNTEYLKMANEIGGFRRQLQKELSGTQYDPIKSASQFLKEQQGA